MNPRVCCICLTADRQAQTDRAVRSFLAQTYEKKHLVILDTGRESYSIARFPEFRSGMISLGGGVNKPEDTIGRLRNLGNDIGSSWGDIIAHWDSDDWSAPTRLEEQVRHLQASGADVVGYSDMLFWRRGKSRVMCDSFGGDGPDGSVWVDSGQAWLHNNGKPNYALGTSLMYWRKTWERKPFPDVSKGCDDYLWVRGLKVASVSSVIHDLQPRDFDQLLDPMMVAEIHGGNTCARIVEPSTDWTRVPAWDSKLQEIMRL